MSQESSDNTEHAVNFFFDIQKRKVLKYMQPICVLELIRIKNAVPELPPPADVICDPDRAASHLASVLPFHVAMIHAVVRREALNPLPEPGTICVAMSNLPYCLAHLRGFLEFMIETRNLPATLGGSLLKFLNDVKAALQLSTCVTTSESNTYVEIYSTVVPELRQSANNLLAVLENMLGGVGVGDSAVEQPEVAEGEGKGEGKEAATAVELAVKQPEVVEGNGEAGTVKLALDESEENKKMVIRRMGRREERRREKVLVKTTGTDRKRM